MHAISRNLYPLVVAISLTLLAGSMPSSSSKPTHDRSAMQPNQSANPKSLSVMDILSESAVPQTALFELEDDSVAVHQMAAVAQRSPGTRLSLSDPAATALEAALTTEQRDFEARAATLAPESQVVVELRKLANAVSIRAPGYQLAQIAALPGVRRLQLSRQYHALLSASVPLINAPSLWNRLGGPAASGRGVKIAILDSGIDQTNPMFSDSGFVAPGGFPRGDNAFTNNKVIVAKAFLSDPTLSPGDQNGHGTHIAGIAAGDANTPTPLGTISGVAPGALLGNYRVLDINGIGDEGLVTRGLEEALADGFDIANISFGAPASTAPGVLESAVALASAGGMTVVAAAGDGGESWQSSITSPGTAPNAITVAASSNAHFMGHL